MGALQTVDHKTDNYLKKNNKKNISNNKESIKASIQNNDEYPYKKDNIISLNYNILSKNNLPVNPIIENYPNVQYKNLNNYKKNISEKNEYIINPQIKENNSISNCSNDIKVYLDCNGNNSYFSHEYKQKKYNLNILYYDEALRDKDENCENCTFFEMNTNGNFYGCHYFDIN